MLGLGGGCCGSSRCDCHCGLLGFVRAKSFILIQDELYIFSREICNGGNMTPTPNASRKIAIQIQMLLQWDRPVEGWILFDVP